MSHRITILKKYFNDAEFGLEQESLRVDREGHISKTPHPFPGEQCIDRDFCENQIEMITDVYSSVDKMVVGIGKLRSKAAHRILGSETGPEYLWPFSSPPFVSCEDEIPVAKFSGELKEKEEYRYYLAEKYGKWKMLFSGIHYNFSFKEEMVRELFEEEGETDFKDFKDRFYLSLAKDIVSCSWLIVYLTAASPVLDKSFRCMEQTENTTDVHTRFASPRCSEIGYWNKFDPDLDFTNVDEYIRSIEAYIQSGELRAGSELYYPVRLKPRGKYTSDNLRNKGVNHIELRMLDLNPLCPEGIEENDLYFIYLLILYLAMGSDLEVQGYSTHALENMKQAALYDVNDIVIKYEEPETDRADKTILKRNIQDAALQILDKMETVLSTWDEKARECISLQKKKVLQPDSRYAVILRNEYGNDYMAKSMELAAANTEKLLAKYGAEDGEQQV